MKEPAQRALLGLLRAYQRFLSPLFPPACRYVPTCSEFAMEAIARYGGWRGSGLALWRLLRCHPLARGGFDPVPVLERAVGESQGRRTPNMLSDSVTSHE
jgi:putative membrane protein insertion efficiency factor